MIARLALFALVGVLLPFSAAAQTASGTILGIVVDPQDAPIPGAKITVTNSGTNIARTFTTDDRGSYTFPFLVPGNYSLSAEAQGFRRANRTAIRVSVEDQL